MGQLAKDILGRKAATPKPTAAQTNPGAVNATAQGTNGTNGANTAQGAATNAGVPATATNDAAKPANAVTAKTQAGAAPNTGAAIAPGAAVNATANAANASTAGATPQATNAAPPPTPTVGKTNASAGTGGASAATASGRREVFEVYGPGEQPIGAEEPEMPEVKQGKDGHPYIDIPEWANTANDPEKQAFVGRPSAHDAGVVKPSGVKLPTNVAGVMEDLRKQRAQETAEREEARLTDDKKGLREVLDELEKMRETGLSAEDAKRRKRDRMIAGIGDGLSAIANLVNTSRGALHSYDARASLTAAQQARWDKIDAERERQRKERLQYALKNYEVLRGARADKEAREAKAVAAQMAAEQRAYNRKKDEREFGLKAANSEFDHEYKKAVLQQKGEFHEDEMKHKAATLAESTRYHTGQLKHGQQQIGLGYANLAERKRSNRVRESQGQQRIELAREKMGGKGVRTFPGMPNFGISNRRWDNPQEMVSTFIGVANRLLGKNGLSKNSGMRAILADKAMKMKGIFSGVLGDRGMSIRDQAQIAREALDHMFSAKYSAADKERLATELQDYMEQSERGY